jgi:hypothetical protein
MTHGFIIKITIHNFTVRMTMPSSGMWRRVRLVRTGVSEENVASIFSVERMTELGEALAVVFSP